MNCNTLQCSVLASMIYYYLAQLVSDAYNACLRHFTAPHFTASCLTDNDIVLFMFLIAQNKTSMDVTSSTCSVQPCDTVFSAQKDSNITKISALLLLEQYAQLISFLDQFDYYCCHYFIFIWISFNVSIYFGLVKELFFAPTNYKIKVTVGSFLMSLKPPLPTLYTKHQLITTFLLGLNLWPEHVNTMFILLLQYISCKYHIKIPHTGDTESLDQCG